jgi:hypothetical protein
LKYRMASELMAVRYRHGEPSARCQGWLCATPGVSPKILAFANSMSAEMKPVFMPHGFAFLQAVFVRGIWGHFLGGIKNSAPKYVPNFFGNCGTFLDVENAE